MKLLKIITLIIGISITNIINAQYTYEDLYEKAGFQKDAKELIENLIDGLASNTPNVSNSEWTRIKSNLDYSKYKNRTIAVLKKHYTLEEVKRIFLQNDMLDPVNDTGYFLFKPKDAAVEDMYNAGKLSGRELIQQAVILLKEG